MKKTIIAGAVLGSLFFGHEAMASTHTVKPGDSLWKIASKNKISVDQLKKLNNLNNDRLYPGQVLKISSQAAKTAKNAAAPNKKTAKASQDYKVQPGDTLSSIAKRNGTSIAVIMELNSSITNPHALKVGQVLILPAAAEAPAGNNNALAPKTPAVPVNNTEYIVKAGDSLSAIAMQHGITVAELLAANPQIKNANNIRAGQAINVPGELQPNTPAPENANWEAVADQIIETGKKYLGAPYVLGASTARTDIFDCSSFTYRIFAENGITLPRTSRAQSELGTPVPLTELRKGDLIFFDTDKDGVINHVSVVMDQDTLLHAATSTGVSISSSKYYWNKYAVKAIRLL